MMKFPKELLWLEDAFESWSRSDKSIRQRVLRALERYANTGAGDVKRLKGKEEFSLHVGDWRVLFQLDERSVLVTVIGHRSVVYKQRK